MKISEMRTWTEVKARMLADMTPVERIRGEKALQHARARYINEIRRYRGINRIREMYRRRKR